MKPGVDHSTRWAQDFGLLESRSWRWPKEATTTGPAPHLDWVDLFHDLFYCFFICSLRKPTSRHGVACQQWRGDDIPSLFPVSRRGSGQGASFAVPWSLLALKGRLPPPRNPPASWCPFHFSVSNRVLSLVHSFVNSPIWARSP